MFVRAPTRIGPASPRSTAPYQMLASSPSWTSPSTTAFGATNAVAGIRGVNPRTSPIMETGRTRRAAPGLLVLGIPLAEVFRAKLLEKMAEILRFLLGRLLRRRRHGLRLHRLLEQLVDDEDRGVGPKRDGNG